jgi:hypothetical protein
MKKQKSEIKGAQDLSMRDSIFEVADEPMLEHMKLADEYTSLNNVSYFSLNNEKVKEIILNEEEDGIVVNGKHSLKFNVGLKPKVTDILTDERQAITMILASIGKEKKKCRSLINLAEQCLEGLNSNSKIYEEKARDLDLHVVVKDEETGNVEVDTDEEK